MTHAQAHSALSAWYDGDCPVCRQEVALYRRIDRDSRIEWIDIVTLADGELPSGKSRRILAELPTTSTGHGN